MFLCEAVRLNLAWRAGLFVIADVVWGYSVLKCKEDASLDSKALNGMTNQCVTI